MDLLTKHSSLLATMQPIGWLMILLFTACNHPSAAPFTIGETSIIEVRQPLDSTASEIVQTIEPYRHQIAGIMKDTLFILEEDLPRGTQADSIYQKKLWNWVCQAVLTYAEEVMHIKADACLLNSGGLRKDLSSGPILVSDLFELLPFDNYLVFIEVRSAALAEMKSYLEQKMQPFAGMRLGFEEDSLRHFEFSNASADSLFVTINYLADGGDKMTFWEKGKNRNDTEVLIRDAVIWYARAYGVAGKAFDGRTYWISN